MELRKDYILDRWVIISEGRGQRPKEFESAKSEKSAATCFFCPGNEQLTPPEIGRISEGKNWLIRWFPNKFPAAALEGDPSMVRDGFLVHAAAYGKHEVIAETPDHEKQLADLTVEHISRLLKVYSDRIFQLSKDKNTKYVILFKNHGQMAGTSLVHSHTQLVSLNLLPQAVIEETNATKRTKKCPYCQIIEKERKSARLIYENDSCICIAPYASRFNYEAWIFPKRHVQSITDFSDKEYSDCAKVLKQLLVKLASIAADYNFVLHYAPKGKDLHFHIELLPRIAFWGGFELLSNIVINSVPPEKASEFYKR